MSLPKLKIYTDGSCKPNPGPGGWGAVIVDPKNNSHVEKKGREVESTNNRMELMAPIEALKSLSDPHEVEIVTDSKYVKDGITLWVKRWQERGWMTQDMQEVKNQELWNLLLKEIRRHKVSWSWVKGHSDNKYNDLADKLAASARGVNSLPLHDKNAVHFYLGITWKQSTGVGGWCLVMNYRNHMKVVGGKKAETTANRLYVEAAATGLKHLKKDLPVYLYTTSGYLRDGAQNWLSGWAHRNWETRDGREVSNKLQWQNLKSLIERMRVRFILVEKENSPCFLQEAKELAREFEIGE